METAFAKFDYLTPISSLNGGELAVMMVGIVSRQAATPTARIQTRLNCRPDAGGWLSPSDGAFNGPAARQLLTASKQE